MLLALGAVQFTVRPFNTHETSRESTASFAKKDVVGTRPVLEFVGEGEEKRTIKGKLYPNTLGGLGALAQLHQLRLSGVPQYLMQGDGAALGWFVIESVQETNTEIGRNGVPNSIEFSIELCRADKPSGAALITNLFTSLFG